MSDARLHRRATKTVFASASLVVLLAFGFATPAQASDNHYGVTISTAPTKNMTFSNGVYAPTGRGWLNVSDLQNALASGNVEVTTGNGSGGNEIGDLHVNSGLTWASANALTLDAYHSLYVDQPISDTGTGALSLTNNDGGKGGNINYGANGYITIWGLSNALKINGRGYKLVGDIHTLANAIAANPSGTYALANAYDASKDGPYSSAPIPQFEGIFNGLGNTISNLQIVDKQQNANIGMFGLLTGAKVSSIRLVGETVKATPLGTITGGLVADVEHSAISDAHVTGTIAGTNTISSPTGGLVGVNNSGIIKNSSTSATVRSAGQSIGGLVGYNYGVISQSFSTGKTVASAGANEVLVGDLVGQSGGAIVDSYATGEVDAGYPGIVGGLIGYVDGHSPVTTSYSTGFVNDPGANFGGFVGYDGNTSGWISDCYWDVQTSRTNNGVDGGNEPGITGLTTSQLQSGLPAGFDPTVWAENPSINNGLPYLIANPPPQ